MMTMNIIEMIKQGLQVARTSKSLWLYGFFVGLWASVKGGSQGHAPAAAPGAAHALTGGTALLAIAILALIVASIFMYFVSEGALIEGVTRVRRGKTPTVYEGWRDGLAHWGVLLRIGAIFLGIIVASLTVLVAPAALAQKLSGTTLAVTLAVPAVLIAVLWLVTLYMWQAFAARIAVLENRRALDAIGKARLFLHGRLLLGLKLAIAAVLGRLFVLFVGVIGLAVAAALIVAVMMVLGMTLTHAGLPVIALGAIVFLPMTFVLLAISGTTQSSIWTIGYLTQEGI
jgi:hypothetical protein